MEVTNHERSFCYVAPSLWNSLPFETRTASLLLAFLGENESSLFGLIELIEVAEVAFISGSSRASNLVHFLLIVVALFLVGTIYIF